MGRVCTLIRDPYTGARKGEVSLTALMLVGDVIVLRGGAFVQDSPTGWRSPMDPAMNTETRFRELRAQGRRLTGTVMRYGDVATIAGVGAERFSVFAFDKYLRHGRGTKLNIMHEPDLIVASTRRGDLTFTDSPEALDMVATLPSGSAYDSVLALIGDRLTTGLSVEFVALEERTTNGTRVIQAATLPALGIVDDPAYSASGVEVRRRGRGLSGEYRYNTDRVTRDRGRRRKVRVSSGAFSWQLEGSRSCRKSYRSRSRRRSRAARRMRSGTGRGRFNYSRAVLRCNRSLACGPAR